MHIALIAVLMAWQLGGASAPVPAFRVSGVVLEEHSLVPVPMATVVLEHETQPRQMVVADGRGQFWFDAVPAGRITLRASHTGFVPVPLVVDEPPRTVVVRASEDAQDVVLHLVRGGAIEGRVLSPAHAPLSGATVVAMQCVDRDVCTRITGRGAVARTDHRGGYRLFGLRGGDYIIAASARLSTDVSEVGLFDPQSSRELGEGRPRPLSAPAPAIALLTTFAPGSLDPLSAARIKVEVGQTVEMQDVYLRLGGAGRLSGRVAPGALSPALPRALFLFPDSVDAMVPPQISVEVRPDGSFETTTLPAGTYRLVAKVAAPGAPTHWAEARVSHTGGQTAGLLMALQPTLSFTGAVHVDGVRSASPQVSLSLRRRDVAIVASNVDIGEARFDGEGRFSVDALLPGRYGLQVTPQSGSQRTLWLKGVLDPNGTDLRDDAITIRADAPPGSAVVELSARPSVVEGTLQKDGLPPAGAMVVAFPRDSEQRSLRHRVATALVAPDGAFSILGLPSGDYILAPISTIDPDDLTLSAFAALATVGTPVSVIWGSTVTRTLRLSR